MRIVSNTGPIIGLAKIGEESEQIDKALNEFIHVKEIHPMDPAIKNATSDLDEGERQVIGLASSLGKDVLILMDDHAGRQVAKGLNLPVSGVVGLLLLAKRKGCP